MDTTTTPPAVTAHHLLQTLEHPDSVCVWLTPIADVEVTVLTAAQEAEARIAVLFGYDEASTSSSPPPVTGRTPPPWRTS
jgi:hypothetical protein